MPCQNKELLQFLSGATEQAAQSCRISESPSRFDFSQVNLNNPQIVDSPEFLAAEAAGIPRETVIRLIFIRLGGANIKHKYGK